MPRERIERETLQTKTNERPRKNIFWHTRYERRLVYLWLG